MRYMPPGNARSGAPTPSNVMGVPHNFTPGQQQQMFINEQQMRMGMQHRIPQGAIGMRMMVMVLYSRKCENFYLCLNVWLRHYLND